MLLLLHVCLIEAMINQKHTVLPKWDMTVIFIRHESIIFLKWRICTSRRHTCFADATTVWVAWHGVHIYTSITSQHSIKYVCVYLSFSSVIVAVAASLNLDGISFSIASVVRAYVSKVKLWVWSMRNDTKTKCSDAYQAPEEEASNGRLAKRWKKQNNTQQLHIPHSNEIPAGWTEVDTIENNKHKR